MRSRIRWFVLLVSVLALMASALPASADHATRPATRNIHAKGHSPHPATFLGEPDGVRHVNSDIAFWGNLAFDGNYDGWRVIDISDPDNPTELAHPSCNGDQGDLVVWENILVRSWNSKKSVARLCDGQTVPAGWEGVHVFDISNPTDPSLVASVELPCGSHTATLAPDLAASRFGRWAEPKLDALTVPREGRLLLAHLALAAGLVMLGVGVALARVAPPVQAAAEEAGFPVHAVAWLESEDMGDRSFNRYEWGGYLIHERPDRLVFIDGRAQDVYTDEQLTLYAATISVQIDPQPVLDRYRIDHVVFFPDNAFAAWLDASFDWERAYADSVAVVWVRSP